MSIRVSSYKFHDVVMLSLDRPDVHNAFNPEMIKQVIVTLKKLEKEKIRLLILSGMGKSFCAGADLNWMRKMKEYSKKDNLKDSQLLNEMFRSLNEFKAPVIAVVQGAALGGGVGLMAVADYVITHQEASFGFTEVNLGLVPAVISPYVINKIGESWARAYFLSGARFKGAQALTMGLAHQVVENEGELSGAMEKAVETFLKAGPEAQKLAKKLVSKVVVASRKKAIYGFTCETIAKQRTTAEGQEGMSALLEKRVPSWIKK